MKKNIQKKTNEFFKKFKNDIKNNNELSKDKLIQFIYDYPTISFDDEDFKKRKRIKNKIPVCNRCIAIKSSNTQCTRRKKENSNFCGTHMKGTPHGTVNNINVDAEKKISTHTIDINGIYYYVDDNGNVYDPTDIHKNIKNPKIIYKYTKNDDDSYSILKI